MIKTFKQLNYMLSNGLYVISAKIRKANMPVQLLVSDLTTEVRVEFDMQKERIIGNSFGVVIPDINVLGLVNAITGNVTEKKPAA